jgi:hypothetical protein
MIERAEPGFTGGTLDGIVGLLSIIRRFHQVIGELAAEPAAAGDVAPCDAPRDAALLDALLGTWVLSVTLGGGLEPAAAGDDGAAHAESEPLASTRELLR